MKNLLIGSLSILLVLGIAVFGLLFLQTQAQAAFNTMSIEVYVVRSVSRLIWLIFSLVGFILLSGQLDVSGD